MAEHAQSLEMMYLRLRNHKEDPPADQVSPTKYASNLTKTTSGSVNKLNEVRSVTALSHRSEESQVSTELTNLDDAPKQFRQV
jgi:hypothetical protein